MKKYLSCLLALALACGGEATGEYPSADAGAGDSGVDLGQSEQGLRTQMNSTNGTNQYITGVMKEDLPLNGLTYTVVNTMSNGATWFVPRVANLTFKVEQGQCSAADLTILNFTVDTLFTELNGSASIGSAGWTFTRSSTGTHVIRCHSLPTSPLGSNNIRNYSRTQCTADQSKIINSIASGLPSNVAHYSTCIVQIDMTDIFLKGANLTEDNKLLWHAVAQGVIKMVGVGSFPGSRLSAGDEVVTPINTPRVVFSSGELCRTRNYSRATFNVLEKESVAGCANN